MSRIERGDADRLPVRTLASVADALGARLSIRLHWQGEELDRLLDRDHARLVEIMLARLRDAGWLAEPEVTFQVRGERGAIDILAWHPPTASLLVVEVKSVVPDIQATLGGVDRKARLGPAIGRERGWTPRYVSRLLVLPHDRTARRRLAEFQVTFQRAFPSRTIEIRRWLQAPAGPIAGVLFVPIAGQERARHRIRRPVGYVGRAINSGP